MQFLLLSAADAAVVVVIRLSGWIAAHSSSVVLILRPWWWLPSARSWWQWSRNGNSIQHMNWCLDVGWWSAFASPQLQITGGTHTRPHHSRFFVEFSGFTMNPSGFWLGSFLPSGCSPQYQQELIPQDLANTVVTPVKGASCLVSCLLSMIFTYCATCP